MRLAGERSPGNNTVHPTLHAKSADAAVKRRRELLARRVVDCLHELPNRRLLCFLDDEEWQSFKDVTGVANRGFYRPIKVPDPSWRRWNTPLYIVERLMVDNHPVFDDFIYLHGSTWSSDIGLTMTLAHELQHFIQHSEQAKLWAANSLIPKLKKATIRALGLRWCDIPHEREARIVSKRTAEQIFGAELVRQYIDGKIAEFVTECDAADWECIRGLATSAAYDLARATKLFFPRLRDHKPELERTLRGFQSEDPGFPQVDLEALLSGAD